MRAVDPVMPFAVLRCKLTALPAHFRDRRFVHEKRSRVQWFDKPHFIRITRGTDHEFAGRICFRAKPIEHIHVGRATPHDFRNLRCRSHLPVGSADRARSGQVRMRVLARAKAEASSPVLKGMCAHRVDSDRRTKTFASRLGDRCTVFAAGGSEYPANPSHSRIRPERSNYVIYAAERPD
jgi:hypothetical protein